MEALNDTVWEFILTDAETIHTLFEHIWNGGETDYLLVCKAILKIFQRISIM